MKTTNEQQKPLRNLTPPPAPPQVAPDEPEPTLILAGLGPVAARAATIASVHFMPQTIQFMHSQRRTFTLPAAPPDGVSYVTVWDSQQPVPSWPDFNQPCEYVPMAVPVETILDDCLRTWGWIHTSRGGLHRCGIDKIAGSVATKEEVAALRKLQETMCRAVVNEADIFHRSGKGEITEFHRKCLTWLGSEQRPWFEEISLGVMKTGPLSGQKIPMTALADGPHSLLQFYRENPSLDPLQFGDTFLAELFAKDASLRRPTKAL